MNQLFRLKRANSKGEKAPHKPILLLCLIKLIEDGEIVENKFPISPTLIFYFRSIWNELVHSDQWKPKIFLPFFHLSNDKKVWELILENGVDINLTSKYSPRSLGSLVESVSFGRLHDSLIPYFFESNLRSELKTKLIQFYFPSVKIIVSTRYKEESRAYYNRIEREIFTPNINEIEYGFDENDSVARSSLFKSKIPSIYNNTCAISRLSITTSSNVSMIDACHIEPWSINYNDTIVNGIALTPTIHRAFDKHLITIDRDYRVVVSDDFIESGYSAFGIKKLHGSKILLPESRDFYPSQELLETHRQKFKT